MVHIHRFLGRLSCGVLLLQIHAATAADPLLPSAQRVLFLGDSITYAGGYVEAIETYFATRFPSRRIAFINAGLPSETVSGLSETGHAGGQFPRPDLHERLGRVLDTVKPDTVFACYGMNDGIYLPFSTERFSAFTNGITRLRQRVSAAQARLILLTPPVFDERRGKGPGYAHTLDRYSDWLLTRRAAGWDVLDIHGPMDRALVEGRRTDPGFFLANDGVHAGDAGHWIIAKQILVSLGARDLAGSGKLGDLVADLPAGAQILALVQQKQRVLKDAVLTQAGHKRPGMNPGLPLAEAETKAAQLDAELRTLSKK